MFLGDSPRWYKQAILGFLIINPILLFVLNSLGLNGGFVLGWVILLQFIFTLALALKCYPLQPGGLLAIEALVMDLSNPYSMMHEIEANIEVILLLVFMVAGIFFMKNLMLTIFTKLLLNVKSKVWLSLLYCFTAAFLSAFLDALTVTAVLIGVTVGFYRIYHLIISNKYFDDASHDIYDNSSVSVQRIEELEDFKGFLRELIMHGAVGTALGGVCTIVGEPQNLLIAKIAGWDFMEFFLYMAPVTMPVFVAGLILCFCLERFKLAGFGSELPDNIRSIFLEYASYENKKNEHDSKMKAELAIELFVLVLLILALAFHIAEVGIIGLGVIILLTSFKGITHEHYLGDAFKEALPFTALLCVFFAVVSVIHEQHLFSPIIDYIVDPTVFSDDTQTIIFFLANGVLSAISDNVFVATIYINEVKALLDAGTISLEHFNNLTIAINTGTNIPSIATPNGQAAFLFLLTSSLAPLINLSYLRMVLMALPYTIVLTIVALISVNLFI
tara:strand:+ start:1207 stop:2712 length:1506 start_codon:yes stop_codon:yes gene_type:complete